MPAKIFFPDSSSIVSIICICRLLGAGCDVVTLFSPNEGECDAVDPPREERPWPKVFLTLSEACEGPPFDYVIAATKVFPTQKTAEDIAPAVTEGHTRIALIQNGIGIEDEYAKQFPKNPLLSCIAWIKPPELRQSDRVKEIDQLWIGTYPALAARQPADELIALFNSAGCNSMFKPDMQDSRWLSLLMHHATWSPICALTMALDVDFLTSSREATSVIKGVMGKIITICQALGHDRDALTAFVSRIMKPALKRVKDDEGITPTMLEDVVWSRDLEVEALLGNPVRIARQHGVHVPRLKLLYALIKMLDGSAMRREATWNRNGQKVPERTSTA